MQATGVVVTPPEARALPPRETFPVFYRRPFEYLNATGERIQVGGPYSDRPGGAPEYPITVEEGVLSPDGATLAYLESEFRSPDGDTATVDLVVWDLATGTESQRIVIELGDGVWPGRLDYDGAGAVLGRRQGDTPGSDERLTPLRIESIADGGVTELPDPGAPSLVKFDLR